MKFFSTIKSAFKQVLVVLLAGVLLLASTACSQANATDAPKGKAITPGQVQPYEGGMNNFSDVDKTRLNTEGASAKAKALKDRVQTNINEKRADSVDQYVENYRTGTPLNERVGNIGKDVKRGSENLVDDTKQASDRLGSKSGRAFDNAADNTKAAGKDAIQDTKRSIDKTSDFVKDKASDAASATKRAID